MKITFLKKFVSAIIRKILVCDMESCYKNISKIHSFLEIFKIILKSENQNWKKITSILENQSIYLK